MIMRHLSAKIFGLVALFGAAVFASGNANAVIIQIGQPGFMGAGTAFDSSGYILTTIPNTATVSDAYWFQPSNTEIGNQSPGNVELQLEAATAFNQGLSFVGGGSCAGGVLCTAIDLGGGNTGNQGTSSIGGLIYAIHFDNEFVAFLFDQALSSFQIDGLRFGVSNIYVYNTGGPMGAVIPLPAALPLFGTALAGLVFLGWRRKRRAA